MHIRFQHEVPHGESFHRKKYSESQPSEALDYLVNTPNSAERVDVIVTLTMYKLAPFQVVGVALVRNTFRGNYQPNGYRDIKLLVEVSLDDEPHAPQRTHLCEVQLHFEPFFSLKEGAHKVYEWARELRVRDRMDPQGLFKGMRSELLEEMIRIARKDWNSLRSLALADLLTTAGRHQEAGELLQEVRNVGELIEQPILQRSRLEYRKLCCRVLIQGTA